MFFGKERLHFCQLFMNKFLVIFLVFIFSLVSIAPLFHVGYFPMHDNTQVARVSQMAISLSDGLFPVRWAGDLGYGYGYPLFNFYAPLAYYIGALFVLLGFAPIDATKIMFGVGMVTAGFSMFFLVKHLFGDRAGIIASLLYMLAPYHASLLYVRGAIGEMFAYAFLPLCFLGLWGIYKTGKYRYVLLFSLGFAAVIISHNLTTLMLLPFLAIATLLLCWCLYRKKEKKEILFTIFGLCMGIILACFYMIPAIFEMKYANISSVLGGGSNPLDHFVCISQLWSSPWGYGGSAKGCIDGMSFVIGKIHILVMASSLIALLFTRKVKNKDLLGVAYFAFSVVLVSLFAMTDFSTFLWKMISFSSYIQFPWRYLSFVAFGIAVLGGFFVWFLEDNYKKNAKWGILFIGLCVLFFNAHYFNPHSFWNKKDTVDYFNNIKWTISEISDEYLPSDFIKPKDSDQIPLAILSENSDIDKLVISKNTNKEKIIFFNLEKDKTVIFNLTYFPAWSMVADGKKEKGEIQRNGLFAMPFAKGVHEVNFVFSQTPLERYANYISLLGILLLSIGIIYSWKKKYF